MAELEEVKWLASAEELSLMFDVDQRTLQRWAQQGRIVKVSRNSYDLASVAVTRLADYAAEVRDLKEKLRHRDDKSDLTMRKLAANVRIAEADAAMRELDLKIKDGSLLDFDAASKALSNTLVSCRNKILGIPSKLALQLSGMKDALAIQSLLTGELSEALNELAEDFRESDSE